ncbi:MlaD family protein [Pedosphaera parvula]|uniref:Mammalian cell entry related domain protein n=1 Tax=Pedosphaera parvula (strain Ellin514) TaxID=320771 RepID=B9XQZ7_PEDPL|nr:MlaD family protein [Pedosphaera parvula]EEF57774.1 Mammalian cell entry related domain protein [Pedosphaera parvula Ellin514]
MSARPNSYKIGLFVIIGLGVLIAGLFAFGARGYFQQQRVFETYVTGEVQGLAVGSPVKLRGVTIGKVTYIGFIWNEYPQYKIDYVLIRFEVPKETSLLPPPDMNFQTLIDREIARGLRARVQGQGITGSSIVALDYLDPKRNPPLQVPWTPKHYYIPSAPGQFTEVVASIQKILAKLEELNLSNTVARADTLMESADLLVKHVDRMDFVALGTNANALVAELRDTNVRLQATLKEAQGAIKDTDLPAVGRRAQELEAKLTDLGNELQKTVAGLDTGSLNATLASAREAIAGLNDLMSKLKQQPSSLIFSKPPPPAKSVETPKAQ